MVQRTGKATQGRGGVIEVNGTQHLTMNEFKDALVSAAHGEAVVYAIGDVAYSRRGAPELSGVAGMAWYGYERGELALTQRRIPEKEFIDRQGKFAVGQCFEYRATKRANPRPLASLLRE